MFGYVMPAIPELRVKDYSLFRAYYCGLCKSIGHNVGQLPRFSLNYDMTFLAIFIDALTVEPAVVVKNNCFLCPLNNRQSVVDNTALRYAAFCNTLLAYYKLLDDVKDDRKVKAFLGTKLLKPYIKDLPGEFSRVSDYVLNQLQELSLMEKGDKEFTLDEFAHPFSNLVGGLLSIYFEAAPYKDLVYWFGYNLGKWTYIIDAYDDLESDHANNEFNPIQFAFKNEQIPMLDTKQIIAARTEFVLISCARACLDVFAQLPLQKNQGIIKNILELGLMNKIEQVLEKGGEPVG